MIVTISSLLGVIVYLRSGIIAYGYNQVGFFDEFLDIFMIFPTNCLVGAAEWGFLFRRYQVWNNWDDEVVELDPYHVKSSYLFKYLYSIVFGSIFYAAVMALIQLFYTFRGRIAAKQGI